MPTCSFAIADAIYTCAGPGPRCGAAQRDAGRLDGGIDRGCRRADRVDRRDRRTCRRAVAITEATSVIDARGVQRHSRLRRSAHAPGVRRRPARRAAAPACRRDLRRDRRRRRRHRQDRVAPRARRRKTSWSPQRCRDSRRCCGWARRPPKSRAATGSRPRRELRMLRAIRRLGRWSSPSSCRRRSWARTRFRSSIARAARRLRRLVIDEMIPAVAARRPRGMVRRLLRAGRLHA